MRRNRVLATSISVLVGIGVLVGTIGSASAEPSAGDWAKLRNCESGGNYAINTGNGYYGAYQFDLGTWRSIGGTGLPSSASPATQDALAYKLWQQRGWSPWTCASIVGLPAGGSGGPAVKAAVVVRQVGRFDAVNVSRDHAHLTVAGWAANLNSPGKTSSVRITVDGRATVRKASMARPDVNRVRHIIGRHGYLVSIPAVAGPHTVCVTITAQGTGKAVSLGCRALRVPAVLRSAKAVKPVNSRTVVTGWTYDNTAAARSTKVIVTVNSVQHTLAANHPSPDVNADFKISGNHRYTGSYGLRVGKNTVCVDAVGVKASSKRSLGCNVFWVGAPRGVVEKATVAAGRVQLRGWGLDPNASSTSANMHVNVNNVGYTVRASQPRRDVNVRLRVPGNHGYLATLPLKKGVNRVCVYTLGSPWVTRTLLGCRNLTA